MIKLTTRGKVLVVTFVIGFLLVINYFITPDECRNIKQPPSKMCEQLLKES
jgi:hypothetical protein